MTEVDPDEISPVRECWIARSKQNPDRFRLQLEPFYEPPWYFAFEVRESYITETDWLTVGTTDDPVLAEVIHRDVWARATVVDGPPPRLLRAR